MTKQEWTVWSGLYLGAGWGEAPGRPSAPPTKCRACGCPSHPAYECPEVSGQ